jgi:hypothetical protein
MIGLTEARIVHYVLYPEAANVAPEHRPAIVVKNWANPEGKNDTGCVNLQVFLDGSNDRAGSEPGYPHPTVEETSRGIAWRTSVTFSLEPKPGTWHWPEPNAEDIAEREHSERENAH